MCANKRLRAIAGAVLLATAGCWQVDPASLEGRWHLDEVLPADSSSIAALMFGIGTAVLHGTTVEFREGRISIPLTDRDTVRFDYRLRRDTLELRRGAAIVTRLHVNSLTHTKLRLSLRRVLFVFYRQ